MAGLSWHRPSQTNNGGLSVAKQWKRAFGRQISNWKKQAIEFNPGASPGDLAKIVTDMAHKQGFDYAAKPEAFQGQPDKAAVNAKAPRAKAQMAASGPSAGEPTASELLRVKELAGKNLAQLAQQVDQIETLASEVGLTRAAPGMSGVLGEGVDNRRKSSRRLRTP
jgi:hypothetical protein